MGRRADQRDEAGDAPAGRWARRAARREAERRRIPKHGKAFVTLAERMLAERAAAVASGSQAAGRGRTRRKRS